MKTKEELNKKLEKAFKFMKAIKEDLGVDTCIAGGVARDIHFGLIPKDVDIIVLAGDKGLTDHKKKKISKYLYDYFLTDARQTGLSFSFIGSFDHYNGPKVKERIDHIWKVYEHDFDVLAYKASTPKEVVDAFDFNINQFVLDESGVSSYIGDAPLTKLVEVRGDAEPGRIAYIEDKYEMLMSHASLKLRIQRFLNKVWKSVKDFYFVLSSF